MQHLSFAKHALPVIVFVVSQAVVLASAGQIPLDQLGPLAVHHTFHIVLPVAAFVIFASAVAGDVVSHGPPAFSWRLD